MRAIFVNHCHPDCPHVCGTRAREFARALSRQGHKIVLLTESFKRSDRAPDIKTLGAALERHDWAMPFYLAVPPRRASLLEAVRAGRLPRWLRGTIIFYQYLVRGGMFTDWRDASHPYWAPLAQVFRPDVVWGVFGNTDAWAIAQGIARLAECPWVRDLKDQWTAFIPALFRRSLAARYSDGVLTTALSAANATNAAPWFPGKTSVVYSGVPAELLDQTRSAQVSRDKFTISLVGAVYDQDALKVLVAGLRRFLEGMHRGLVELNYAGTDGEAMAEAAHALGPGCPVQLRGQLSFSDYWALVTRSHLNVYVRTAKTGWWHHKIVELLTAQRPILCVPGEIAEARILAERCGGALINAADPAAVAEALEGVWRQYHSGDSRRPAAAAEDLTWDALSTALIEALASVTAARTTAGSRR